MHKVVPHNYAPLFISTFAFNRVESFIKVTIKGALFREWIKFEFE